MTARLYILRHGPAGAHGEYSGPDRDRPLTADGVARTQCVVAHLARIGLKVDAIISSPYTRALQTAEIAAAGLGATKLLRTDDRLAAGFEPTDLFELLAELPDDARVMIVGHEPDLSTAIGALTGGVTRLSKSAIARIDMTDDRSGMLCFLLTPGALGC